MISLVFISLALISFCPGSFLNQSDNSNNVFKPCSNSLKTETEKNTLDDATPLQIEYADDNNFNICHFNTSSFSFDRLYVEETNDISLLERSTKFGSRPGTIPTSYIKKSISDDDNMVEIKSTSSFGYPLSAIGLLVLPNLSISGTAFLVSSGFVLTATHCIASNFNFYRTIPEIGFGLTGIDSNNVLAFDYHVNVTDIYIPRRFFALDSKGNPINNYKYDWALMKIDTPDVINHVGALSIGSGFTLYDKINTFIGYPGERYNLIPHSSSGKGVFEDRELEYELYQYIYDGMSGGPLIFDYFNPATLDEFGLVTGICSSITGKHGDYTSVAVKISNLLINVMRYLR